MYKAMVQSSPDKEQYNIQDRLRTLGSSTQKFGSQLERGGSFLSAAWSRLVPGSLIQYSRPCPEDLNSGYSFFNVGWSAWVLLLWQSAKKD
jgi:hypothetical protein